MMLRYETVGGKAIQSIMEASYKCKCGKTVVISKNRDRALCNECGHYVFKDKRTEFEYRIKEEKNREKMNETIHTI